MAKKLTESQWSDIRTKYVTSDLSYRQMANKYGIPFTTLKDRARKEKWFEQQTQFRRDVDTNKKKIALRAETERYKDVVDTAELGIQKIREKLADPELTVNGLRALMAALIDAKNAQDLKNKVEESKDNTIEIKVEGVPEEYLE